MKPAFQQFHSSILVNNGLFLSLTTEPSLTFHFHFCLCLIHQMDKEAEAAAIKANVIAARKRAEEMAAAARGDVPKVSRRPPRPKSKRELLSQGSHLVKE